MWLMDKILFWILKGIALIPILSHSKPQTSQDLKVTSGTNNTLVFKGQGMTKIHDTTDITVGNEAGITFDLSSGSGLYFKGNFRLKIS